MRIGISSLVYHPALIVSLGIAATIAPMPGNAQTCANPGREARVCELQDNPPYGYEYFCKLKTYDCNGMVLIDHGCARNCEVCNTWGNNAQGLSQCEAFCNSNMWCGVLQPPLPNTCCAPGHTCCGNTCCSVAQQCVNGKCI